MRKARQGIRPIRVLPLGFLCIILIGALLLMLPVSSRDGTSLPFLNALFTSTSASCVTGLVVVDTGTYFSLFGQIVILIMIQLGGLGFMTTATILFSLTGRKISLHDRMTMAEGLGESRLQGIVRLSRSALLVTAVFEFLGMILLSVRFIPEYGVVRGLWYSLFHSVSAFCNAGFDLIGGYRSFTGYSADPYMLFTLMMLIVVGGLGFTVLINVYRKRRFKKLRLHAKLVLVGTLILIVFGTLVFLLIEYDNPETIGGMPFFQKLLNALFQSVTLRTAGFNTISEYALRDASKGVSVLLMLIGGGPAGTAGGLKITTVFTLVLAVRAYIRGRFDTVVFGRTIPLEQVRRALTIFFFGLVFVFGMGIAVSVVEQHQAAGTLGIMNQLFEATSAFCTVGVSSGVTAASTSVTRIMLIVLMYIGRVGLLTVAMSLIEGSSKESVLHYPMEDILIG
ncbi:MAG TPA: potassium transporter TrkG [Eubacteriales bacterium]|nr:potassium transporter TrkG [Eubacteriales bacterium]